MQPAKLKKYADELHDLTSQEFILDSAHTIGGESVVRINRVFSHYGDENVKLLNSLRKAMTKAIQEYYRPRIQELEALIRAETAEK